MAVLANTIFILFLVSLVALVPYFLLLRNFKKRLEGQTLKFEDYKKYTIKIFAIYFSMFWVLGNWQNAIILMNHNNPILVHIAYSRIAISTLNLASILVAAVAAVYLGFRILKITNEKEFLEKKMSLLVLLFSGLYIIILIPLGYLSTLIIGKIF